MTRTRATAALLIAHNVCVVNLVLAGGEPQIGLIDQAVGSQIVVQGKVASLPAQPAATAGRPIPPLESTVTITHVFWGDRGYTGQSFVDYSGFRQLRPGNFANPALEKGEIGLWVLSEHNGRLVLSDSPAHPARVRQRYDDSFANWRTWAEMIERMRSLTPAVQRECLVDLARSPIQELSSWSIRALDRDKSAEMTRMLWSMAAPPPPTTFGQVVLDEVLVERARAQWFDSEVRRAMLRRWVTTTPTAADARIALTRLVYWPQGPLPRLSPVLASDLLATAALNPKFPVEARRSATQHLAVVGSRDGQLIPALDGLVRVLQAMPGEKVSEEASTSLASLLAVLGRRSDKARPTAEQLRRLRQLADGLPPGEPQSRLRRSLTDLAVP